MGGPDEPMGFEPGGQNVNKKLPKTLPCNLVDVVLVLVPVCVYACVLQAAVGTTLDELTWKKMIAVIPKT